HPLDPLTADEIARGREVLVAAGKVGETTRFPNVLLVEPEKAEVKAFVAGDAIERRLLYVLLDTATGPAAEAVVSVTAGEIVPFTDLRNDTPPHGQPQYLFEEYDKAMAIAKADPDWRAAMKRRG